MKKNKKKLFSMENKKEIIYHIINSLLAGFLVFLGAFINGGFDWKSVMIAFIASLIVAVTKFKEYWDGEASEYCKGLVNFI